jgi:hypothetical protein
MNTSITFYLTKEAALAALDQEQGMRQVIGEVLPSQLIIPNGAGLPTLGYAARCTDRGDDERNGSYWL